MSEKLTPALIQRVRDSAARLASYYEVREGHRDLGVPATFLRPLNDICDAAERSLSYVEGDPINAAKIIAWSRMVRNASPGRKWTDTEIRMADAIARIAGGE